MALDIRLFKALCLCLIFTATYGSYVIMIPKQFLLGGTTQVCIIVDDPSAPSGEISLSVTKVRSSFRYHKDYDTNGEEIDEYFLKPSIAIPPGNVEFCEDVPLREGKVIYNPHVSIIGQVAGSQVNFTAKIRFSANEQRTIVQTDKFLYQPGQLVQFRILTHYGPMMNISKEKYPEVWVTTPSHTRIAQWKDVDNAFGLVHLDLQLAEEPEEGTYRIHVKTSNDEKTIAKFKVEEYVLPRFEVTLEPPKYVLTRDSAFSFKVCAKYTFGQPVKGTLVAKISNNGNRDCRILITKNETFSGCKDIEVIASDIRTVDCDIRSVYVVASVTEEGTGVEFETSKSISISNSAVSFKTLYNDKYMKYNLPYTLKVRAELPDGSPASDVPVELCYDGSCKNITTPADGIIKVYVSKFDSKRVIMKSLITRAAMYESSFTNSIERYYSPSNSSLLIRSPEGAIKCTPGEVTQQDLQVLFSTPDLTSAKISVQVVARDRIQFWSSEEYQLTSSDLPYESAGTGSTTGIINIPLTLPHSASPSAWVVVWYIRDDGEVVSDSIELTMDKCLPNTAHLQWSSAQAQPGEHATLSLTSESSSICSLGVVDKSVELLTPKSNALTVASFFEGIQNYFYSRRYNSQINDYRYCSDQHSSDSGYRYYTNYVDSLKMFDNSGLFVFSDLRLETRPCDKQERGRYHSPGRAGGGGGMSGGFHRTAAASDTIHYSAISSNNEASIAEIDEVSDKPRTDFPETWLWDLVVIPPYGVAKQHVSLPDTITEWVGQAVCVHPEKGVGVAEKASITTFTPFFLDLTLPPSIKRGEIIPVKISVFNYMQDSLPVTVLVEDSHEYKILETSTSRANLCLQSHDMSVHTVRIQPSVIGDVNITVSGFVNRGHHQEGSSCGSDNADIQRSDSMIRSVVVEAEGFPREKTWTEYICSDELDAGQDPLESWEVSAPPAIVEGSERGWIAAVGDLLALSVENLGHLIRMPYGCGEQNMLNFAPNIFILQYLEATNQEAPEAKQKLLKFMKTGYQRQLLYLRRDGSFSAFGNADASGSTWLSAFVLKSFSQAKEYIVVDEKTTNFTKKWLQRLQDDDGCYLSIGTLINKAMKGGVTGGNSSVPLTAYVVISLLESGELPTTDSMRRATHCIESHSTDNIYILALKVYAFALARHTGTAELMQNLISLATETQGSLHWELPHTSWKSRSLEVETAGYVILAMMNLDAHAYEVQARKIVKWISSQRNGMGGFVSTQDTVVALQAMASFESHLNRGDLDAVATVKTADFSHSFSVDESNKLLQQQVSIPSLPTTVSLSMTGQGCILMQAVLRYNIPDPEPSDAFSVTVDTQTVRDKTCVTKRVTACASYLLPGEKSNMAVVEVNLVSGYIPDKNDLKKLVRKRDGNVIKRYEVDGSKVSFYVDEFVAEEEVCVNFRVVREITVENVKPGTVVVYDYYQPEFSISKSYTLPPPEDCRYAW